MAGAELEEERTLVPVLARLADELLLERVLELELLVRPVLLELEDERGVVVTVERLVEEELRLELLPRMLRPVLADEFTELRPVVAVVAVEALLPVAVLADEERPAVVRVDVTAERLEVVEAVRRLLAAERLPVPARLPVATCVAEAVVVALPEVVLEARRGSSTSLYTAERVLGLAVVAPRVKAPVGRAALWSECGRRSFNA